MISSSFPARFEGKQTRLDKPAHAAPLGGGNDKIMADAWYSGSSMATVTEMREFVQRGREGGEREYGIAHFWDCKISFNAVPLVTKHGIPCVI